MQSYKVSLREKCDEHPAYIITVDAENIDEAIYKAKTYVAKHGYWCTRLSIKEIFKFLVTTDVTIVNKT